MERTVNQGNLELLNREACQNTVLHCCGETLLHRWDEFLRNVTTLNFVNKLQVAFEAFVNRFNANDDVGKLTATTALLLVNLTEVNSLGDAFFVCYLWTALVTFNLEFATQTVDDDVEVKLTHTADYGLTGFFVSLYTECRVFFSKLLQAYAKTVEVLLSLRFNSDTDNWVWEVHCFEHDWSIFSTQSVTSADILETNAGTDVTAANHFHWVLLVRVHLEEARDAFLLARASVEHVATSFD